MTDSTHAEHQAQSPDQTPHARPADDLAADRVRRPATQRRRGRRCSSVSAYVAETLTMRSRERTFRDLLDECSATNR